jgi:hypothetical protein
MLALRRVAIAFWLLSAGLTGLVAKADDGMLNNLASTDQLAIKQVIERQLEAFQHDDGAAAFAMAAPSIRAMFGAPENFMTMVKNGFQPLYRAKEFAFDSLLEEDGQIKQRMRVVGTDGVAHLALYTMERQPDGHWLIAGCVLLELHEQSV